jgi:hypothetical protein
MSLLLLSGFASLSASDLWDMAVEYYAVYGDMVPGRLSIRFDQYNGRGRLVSSEFSELELSMGPDGEVQSEVVFASKDGKDVTEERRENPSGGAPFGGGNDEPDDDSDSPFAGLQRSPFDPDEQDRVTVVDTGRRERINGIQTRVHEFEQRTGESARTVGTAWIAEESGTPVKVVASISPLPGFVDSFEMIQTYDTDRAGRWFMTSMEFIGEGNILFIRRRLESEFLFSDYFPLPSRADTLTNP